MFNAYWETVLQEVLNQDDKQYPIRFTHLKRIKKSQLEPKARYFLQPPFQRVYLTPQEYLCARLLLDGETLAGTGRALNLSPRTVEYYIKRIKTKLGVRRKTGLIGTLKRIL